MLIMTSALPERLNKMKWKLPSWPASCSAEIPSELITSLNPANVVISTEKIRLQYNVSEGNTLWKSMTVSSIRRKTKSSNSYMKSCYYRSIHKICKLPANLWKKLTQVAQFLMILNEESVFVDEIHNDYCLLEARIMYLEGWLLSLLLGDIVGDICHSLHTNFITPHQPSTIFIPEPPEEKCQFEKCHFALNNLTLSFITPWLEEQSETSQNILREPNRDNVACRKMSIYYLLKTLTSTPHRSNTHRNYKRKFRLVLTSSDRLEEIYHNKLEKENEVARKKAKAEERRPAKIQTELLKTDNPKTK